MLFFIYLWQDKILLYDIAAGISNIYFWLQAQFNLIGHLDYSWFIFAPSLFVIGYIFTIKKIYPREPPDFLRFITVAALVILHTIYIVFRICNTLSFNTLSNGVAAVSLLGLEIIFYLSSLTIYPQIMFFTNRKASADIYEKDVVRGAYQPWVDVFVPTYSEPVEIVRRTLIGCQAVNYTQKRIYLLDDGRRPEMRALASELGCFYISRPNNLYAKAGNINNALKETDGELIAMFDADSIPTKNFLLRTIGFFQEKNLALVITAQSSYNIDMFSHNVMSLIKKSFGFRITQCGRDRFNALLCDGTSFVVRRMAMKDIGGVPTETITEDWAFSIKLQAAGYKTYFLNEALSAGATVESMGEYLQQHIRWAQGTLQSLFAPTNPFKIKGLSFMQRLIHGSGIFHYLLNPLYLLLLLISLFYFFFELMPIRISHGQFWFFCMPMILLNCLTFSWLYRESSARLGNVL